MRRKGPLHRFSDFIISNKVAKLVAQAIISLILAMWVYVIGAFVLELVTGIKVPFPFALCPIEGCGE
jgi:hypothetical protein